MNHLGDTNKMVSDTPRTDAKRGFHDLDTAVDAEFSEQLECELNAANERIKRLEAVVNDPHALWANWLRGDVKLPAGIGDVRQYQERIKRLEDACDEAIAFFEFHGPVGATPDTAYLIAKNIRKAKEAKP